MSSCLIRGVRSVELVVSNLSEAARFYTDIWRLAPVEMPPPNPPPHAGEGRERAQYFRGTGGYHHLLGVHLGARPAVIRIVFDLADRQAIAHLHRVMERAGLKPTAPAELGAPGGGYGFGCKDPDGRNLVFVCECAEHADTADRADRPRKIAMSISTRAILTRASPSSLKRSVFAWSTRMRRYGFCTAPMPIIVRSCWPRPACRRSTTSRSKCRTPIP
jgi:catechol 2,3-dioxygenase-like lactoylglutathione lyase family enzyme